MPPVDCVPAPSIAAVAGVPLVPGILTVAIAGLPAFVSVPGVASVSAVAFIPAVACIPAIDDVLAVTSFPADVGVPVLLLMVSLRTVLYYTMRHIRLSDYSYRIVIFSTIGLKHIGSKP
jgi:hypothetical protein